MILLHSDEYARDILHTIFRDNAIPKQIKQALSKKEMQSVRGAFAAISAMHENSKDWQSKMIYLQDYVTPFSELEPFFIEMKKHVGVSQFNTITFPALFTKQTLNQL
jgi:hypothetical protein